MLPSIQYLGSTVYAPVQEFTKVFYPTLFPLFPLHHETRHDALELLANVDEAPLLVVLLTSKAFPAKPHFKAYKLTSVLIPKPLIYHYTRHFECLTGSF